MTAATDLQGPSREHPFYIVTPRYTRKSAGVRILHQLAGELQDAGYEAFIVWNGPGPFALAEGEDFNFLTRSLSLEHFKTHRMPICIRPETSHDPPPNGLDVVYALNFPGLLGGPAEVNADYVMAYSERLSRAMPRCDSVVYLPACDPEFWTPDPGRSRAGACVYAGKYVEYHGQPLPQDVSKAKIITRSGPDAPDADRLRDILRSSTHCYVFENTSVVTEALLCGCPVVIGPDLLISGMIASEEHGAWGIAVDDDPASLTRARSELPLFRAAYRDSQQRSKEQVRVFAACASSLASSLCRIATGPQPVPEVFEITNIKSIGSFSLPCDDMDAAYLYNIILGREAESRAVLTAVSGRQLGLLVSEMIASDEYRAIARRLLSGQTHSPQLTVVHALAELKAWSERRLPLTGVAREALRNAGNWPALHAALISEPEVMQFVIRAGMPAAALAQNLEGLARLTDIRGNIDELAPGLVRGWALDLNAPAEPLSIELSRGNTFLAETVTGCSRPDILELVGGDGRAGFFIRTPLLDRRLDEVIVRAGRDRVLLPPFG